MNDFMTKKTERQIALDRLKDAKRAWYRARDEYRNARQDATIDLVHTIATTPGGSMTTTELRAATGMDAPTIRSLLNPDNKYQGDKLIRNKNGAPYATVTRGHTWETRKFMLVNDDGSVSPDVTMTQTLRVNKYTISSSL